MKLFGVDMNDTNLKSRADYGVRVARPGYDAYTCAQNQLVFNSSWPIVQITKVINLSKDVATSQMCVGLDYSDLGWREYRETLPDGVVATYTDANTVYTVGKNYIWVIVKREYFYTSDYMKQWTRFTYKKLYHGLGFVPMFYRSEYISELEGKLVLTSVDLTTDVDYPYTEEATMFLGKTNDYGITSESVFGKRVPGLRSDMFSKLVQAVKTEESSTAKYHSIYWSPLSREGDFKEGCLMPYETLGFYGYNNPFMMGDIVWASGEEGNVQEKLAGWGSDGPYYTDTMIVRGVSKDNSYEMKDAFAFTDRGQSVGDSARSSLVVMRSPMVSPEYEEIEV